MKEIVIKETMWVVEPVSDAGVPVSRYYGETPHGVHAACLHFKNRGFTQVCITEQWRIEDKGPWHTKEPSIVDLTTLGEYSWTLL